MIEITEIEHNRNVEEYNRLSSVVDGFFERTNSQIEYLTENGKEFMKFYNNFRRGNKLNKDAMKLKLATAQELIESGKEFDSSIYTAFINIQHVVDTHRAQHNAIHTLTKASADFLFKESERLQPKEYFVTALLEIQKMIPVMEKMVDEFELHFEKLKEVNTKFKTDFIEEVKKYWP